MTNSRIKIMNIALQLKLGSDHIMDEEEKTKDSRVMKTAYDFTLDRLLRQYKWAFATRRVSLPALSEKPLYRYANQYQLPADFLRLHSVGMDDLPSRVYSYGFESPPENYESAPYTIEGRRILADIEAPLKICYAAAITDPMLFDSCFVDVLATSIAIEACESITGSPTRKQSLEQSLQQLIIGAVQANAIEKPPEMMPQGTWMGSRY